MDAGSVFDHERKECETFSVQQRFRDLMGRHLVGETRGCSSSVDPRPPRREGDELREQYRAPVDVPVWDYRRIAFRVLQETGGSGAGREALEALAAQPLRFLHGDVVSTTTVHEAAAAANVAIEDWLSTYEHLHALGLIVWDAGRSLHVPAIPDSIPPLQA